MGRWSEPLLSAHQRGRCTLCDAVSSGGGTFPLAQPWHTIERVETADGPVELRRRGERDFLITIAGRVLMNSRANRSEIALARLGCQPLAERPHPVVLLGGLGMGCTLRAALDVLPEGAQVLVSEINPALESWCRGPLAAANRDALCDRRVAVTIEDVAERIRAHADDPARPRLDAILLDLYTGPYADCDPRRDPFYGSGALARTRSALAAAGIFAVWSEAPDTRFEARLRAAGFAVKRHRPGRAGLRHAVYIARLAD